jgi:hypothetical protein
VNQLNLTAMDEILNKNEAHHTFTGSNGTSWIDHIIVNNEIKQRVIETNIIDSPINTSDHFAVEIKLIVKIQNSVMNKKLYRNEEWERKVKIDWQNSQDRNKFNKECKLKLEIIIILISPFKIQLIQMIKITLDYMENWKIKINLEKTNFIQSEYLK